MMRLIDAERLLDGFYYATCIDDDFSLNVLDHIEALIEAQPTINDEKGVKPMLKLIRNTITAAAKLYAVCVFVNELAYLNNEVHKLRREIDALKSAGKG